MHINIKTTHVELDEGTKEYLDEKLSALEKYVNKDDESVKVDVELEHIHKHQKGDVFRAEVNVLIDGKMIRAESRGEALREVIDKVQEESAKNLRRHKKKRFSMLKRGGAKMKNLFRFGRK